MYSQLEPRADFAVSVHAMEKSNQAVVSIHSVSGHLSLTADGHTHFKKHTNTQPG